MSDPLSPENYQPGDILTESGVNVSAARREKAKRVTEGYQPDAMHVLSLGAGVQSSTMALMAASGEITPMPTAAIFADTGDESPLVYKWLDWIESQLPFPVYRVKREVNGIPKILSEEAISLRTSASGNVYLKPGLPVFFNGGDGFGSRQCMLTSKIEPIRKKLRELRKTDPKRYNKKLPVMQWIGISLDEAIRMKHSRDKWCTNIWPLVDRRMTRHDCLRWMEAHGFPQPPRSACVYCPHHSNQEWRRLRNEEPDQFESAAVFEERLQAAYVHVTKCDGTPFLHRSCVPLREVDLSTDAERGQGLLWGNECEGMCGI
jgi:hypothetical protein